MDLADCGLKPFFFSNLQVDCLMYFIIVMESWIIEHFPVYLTKSSLFLLHGYFLGFPSHSYYSPVYSPSRPGPGMERMLNKCWLLIRYTLILLKWILPLPSMNKAPYAMLDLHCPTQQLACCIKWIETSLNTITESEKLRNPSKTQ